MAVADEEADAVLVTVGLDVELDDAVELLEVELLELELFDEVDDGTTASRAWLVLLDADEAAGDDEESLSVVKS